MVCEFETSTRNTVAAGALRSQVFPRRGSGWDTTKSKCWSGCAGPKESSIGYRWEGRAEFAVGLLGEEVSAFQYRLPEWRPMRHRRRPTMSE